MKLIFPVWFTLVVFLLSTGTSWSADFEKGEAAYFDDDYATALRELKPLAEQGNADAQLYLGNMYQFGDGVPENLETALKWYTLAAEQGNEFARLELSSLHYTLGEKYYNGEGVPTDAKTAAKWFKLAAEQGYAPAQSHLGLMYDEGKGVSQNHETAVKWYRLAAEQGNAFAKNRLLSLGKEISVQKELIKKAEQGDADAQYQLALKYMNGDGVEKSLSAALSWANKSHRQGHAEAGKLHGELILQDFLFAGEVRELEALGKSVKETCKGDIKCAFDKVWTYLDITGDGSLSLAEIARFQRNIIKYGAANQEETKLETEDFAAINLATIIFLPITASAIVHSFDYDNDGLLSKNEVFRETEFAKLVGLDAEGLATGINFENLNKRLRGATELLPFLK